MEGKIKLDYKTLLSSKNKIGQGFSFATTFVAPKDHESQFFIALDIASPNPKTQELSFQIIDAISEGYLEAQEKSPSARFEEVIKILNEYLAEKFHDGEIFWLGQINAVIGMSHKSKLFLTSAGKGTAFLLRNNDLIELSNELANETADPTKTFANITNGNLNVKDKLIFATPGLSFHLSQEQIKNILANNDVFSATEELKNLLDSQENTLGTSLVLFEALEDLTEKLDLAFSSQNLPKDSTNENKAPQEEELANSLEQRELTNETEISANLDEQIAPEIVDEVELEKIEPPKFSNELNPEALRMEPTFEDAKSEVWANPEEHKQEMKSALGKTWTLVTKHAKKAKNSIQHKLWPKIKEKTQEANKSAVVQNSKKGIKSALFAFFDFIKNFRKKSPTQQVRFLKIAGLSLFLFIFSVLALSYQTNRAERIAVFENKLKEANEEFRLATNALIYEDNAGAKTHLEKAETLANELKTANYKKTQVSKLISDINGKKDQASGITRIENLEILANLELANQNSGFSTFAKINENYYCIDKNAKKVVLFNKTENTVKNLGDLDFEVLDSHVFNNSLYLLSADKLFEFKPETNTISEIKVSGGLPIEKGVALGSYKTFLYILSPEKNQIFRYSKTLDGLSKPNSYIKTKDLDFSNATDISIPEFAFSLHSNGQIYKFSSGAKQKFEVSSLPDEVTNAKKLSIVLNKNYYILEPEKERILVLDSNGTYVKQFVSSNLKNAVDFFVNSDGSEITVLGNSKIYTINAVQESEKP